MLCSHLQVLGLPIPAGPLVDLLLMLMYLLLITCCPACMTCCYLLRCVFTLVLISGVSHVLCPKIVITSGITSGTSFGRSPSQTAATSSIQGNQPFPSVSLPRHTTTQSTAADALDPSEQKSHPRSNENAYLSTSQFPDTSV